MKKTNGMLINCFILICMCTSTIFTGCNIATVTQLKTPTISILDTVVSWETVENASGYSIKINGNICETVKQKTSYSLSAIIEQGTYTIAIKALATHKKYIDSGWSNSVDFKINPPVQQSYFTYAAYNDGTEKQVTGFTSLGRTITEIEIPEYLDGLPITSISKGAFSDCLNIKSIVIPNSVVDIEYGAFYGCKRLEQIILPNNITEIETGTFFGCENLTQIILPDNIEEIGTAAFYGCKKLTQITMPQKLKCIDDYAFQYCYRLKSITLPENVTDIGVAVFIDCGAVVFIESLTPPMILSSCFIGVKAIVVPDSKTNSYKSAWTNYSYKIYSDTTVANNKFIILDNVIIAYYGTEKNVTIADNITKISDGAFSYCDDLTTIFIQRSYTLHSSITLLGFFTFYNCSNLINIYMPDLESLTQYQKAINWSEYKQKMSVLSKN